MRLRCKDCRSYSVKISTTDSRKTFIITCGNPACRSTYARTIDISADLTIMGELQRRRRLLQTAATREKGGAGGWDAMMRGED